MPVGLAIPLLRGIFNLPSAISQEGAGGISTAFFNPQKVESTRRVQGARDEQQPDAAEIDRIISGAKSPQDLEPAFGLFLKLRHQAQQDGLSDEETQRALAPVMGRIGDAARQFITGDTNQQARGLLGLGARLGDPGAFEEGKEVSRLAGREAQAQAAYALAGLRGAQGDQLPMRQDLMAAQTESALASADAARARASKTMHDILGGGAPRARLGDLDRLDKEMRATTDRAGVMDRRTGEQALPPNQAMVDERNARAAELERPAAFPLPAGGSRYDIREVSPEAAPVARQLLYGGGSSAAAAAVAANAAPAPADPAPMVQAPQQAPIPAPTPVLSGRALRDQLVAQGLSLEDATARVRAMIAQQQQGGAGAANR